MAVPGVLGRVPCATPRDRRRDAASRLIPGSRSPRSHFGKVSTLLAYMTVPVGENALPPGV